MKSARQKPRAGTVEQIFVLRSQVFPGRVHYLTGTPRNECRYQPGRMMLETINYLRDMAQTCVRLARTCPHAATAHGLEEVAVDLMAKAKELEREFGN
jgi:hypothetical protein